MILDELRNAALYRSISPRMALALDFLQKTDLAGLAPGRHPLEGESVFALLLNLETKPKKLAFWEAHRRYIDVQYLFEGAERMGRADIRALMPTANTSRKRTSEAEGQGRLLHRPGRNVRRLLAARRPHARRCHPRAEAGEKSGGESARRVEWPPRL